STRKMAADGFFAGFSKNHIQFRDMIEPGARQKRAQLDSSGLVFRMAFCNDRADFEIARRNVEIDRILFLCRCTENSGVASIKRSAQQQTRNRCRIKPPYKSR